AIQVSLDFGFGAATAPNGAAYGVLRAYSANGTLLQTVTTSALLSGGTGQTLTILRPQADIAFITATGSFDYSTFGGATKVTLDNLTFANNIGGSTAPEPFTVTDVNGNYALTNVPTGLQTVSEVGLNGFVTTNPAGDTTVMTANLNRANESSSPNTFAVYN